MKPHIFIGSSVEGKPIADAIQVGLQYDARCTVWHQAFSLSMNTLDTLIGHAGSSDFAIFVFSADDIVKLRGNLYEAARDNVLFEAGLFMGMHGKGGVFIVVPQDNPSFHTPTDLLGFTPAKYDPVWAKTNVDGALGAAVTLIRQAITASSWASRRLDIAAHASFKFDANWPLKLNIKVENHQSVPVAIESIKFDFSSAVQRAPNTELRGGVFTPKFRVGRNEAGEDLYESQWFLPPNKWVETWVPFDPDASLGTLQGIADQKQTGIWRFRCVWLDKAPDARTYEEEL